MRLVVNTGGPRKLGGLGTPHKTTPDFCYLAAAKKVSFTL